MRTKTHIVCDHCGKDNLVVAEGHETSRMLSCPKCGQYHYWVGNVHCMGWADSLNDFPATEAKKLLEGHTTLRPEVAEKLAVMQRRWGMEK